MIKAFILICATSTPQGDCTEATARSVIRLPDVASLQQCLFVAEAMVAPTAVAPKAGEEYMKARCLLGEKLARR